MPAVAFGAPWRPPPPRSPLNALLRRLIRRLKRAGILGVAALLTLVPLAALVGVTQNQAERTVKAEAREAARSSARAGANVVSAEIRGLQDVVQAYAERRLLQQELHGRGPRRGVRRHLRELSAARDGISAAWVLEPDGRLIDILPATPEIVGRSFAFRDYYRGVVSARRAYVSESFVVASRNHPLSVAVADLVPAPDGGRPGILAAGYDLAAIQRFVTRYAAAERIALTVTDQRGKVVAGPGGPRRTLRSLRDDPLVAAALAGRSGFARRNAASGAVLAASAPVAGLGWTVIAEVDEDEALAGVARLRETQLMLGIPLAIGLLAGAALLGLTLRRRARAEEALRLSEERALGIVQTSPDGFVALDKSGRITAWNPAAERMFGWTEGEILGKRLTETIVPPALHEAHAAGMARFLRTREPHVIGQGLELPAVRRDGTEMPIEIAISATERPDGMAIHAFIRDISKRKRDEEELREAHAQAVQASRLKSEFVANMSHELRTPLNGVIGMNDLLLQTPLEPEQREYAAIARRAGAALLSLISDILDFSKIEAGRLELDEVDFEVREVVDDACAILAETAFTKGLELIGCVDPAVPARIRGDDVRLRQVLINLISNGIKFTESGEVVVRVTAPGKVLRFEVSDTGIGISHEHQEKLWEAFTQADASTTRNFGGTGLGLTISRKLVEVMDGTIGVESAPGAGSTFHFELPLTAIASAGVSWTDCAPRGEAPTDRRPRMAEGDATKPAAAEGATILVAEDNPVNQMVAQATLEKLGFAVEIAEDGERARAMSAERDYAAIFMDCQMPRLDGYSATAAIRDREAAGGHRVPIVAMTAHALKGDRERCLAAGMDDYLTKPIDHGELHRVLHRWVVSSPPAAGAPVASDEPAPANGDEAARSQPVDGEAARPQPGPLSHPDGDPRADAWLDPAAAARLRVEHSAAMLRSVAALFDQEAPARLADLSDAARRRDPEPLWQAAHRLKSSCRIVGAVGMQRLCEELEDHGRAGRTEACENLVARLQAAYRPVASALQRQLD